MAKKISFENKINALEEIVSQLESADIPIEEMIRKYEEGMKLSIELKEFLEKAEQKIIEIKGNVE